MTKPNLERIPGQGDHVARKILDRAPSRVDQGFLDSFNNDGALALGRFGMRTATIALRKRSQSLLTDALLASALAAAKRSGDSRDSMVGLAVHFVIAEKLGVSPQALFAGVAHRLPEGETASLLEMFGAREDVTLEAFGWALVDTPDGPDLIPT